MTLTFKVEKREGKLKDDELCMGVVYGPKTESTPVKFNRKEFEKLYKEAGQNTIIALEGLDEPHEVTIHDIDRAPFTSQIHHVDFYALERGAEMTVDVPLVLVGEAPAAKLEANINQIVHSVSVTCKPRDLIQQIEVDISALAEVGDSIQAKDLKIPKTIKLNIDEEAAIVSALAPKQEKEPEPEVDAADVPVAGAEGESEEGTGSAAEESEKTAE